MSVEKARTEHSCYFCPVSIEAGASYVSWEECIVWKNERRSRPGSIKLHPKCALMLANRLVGDAFAADKDAGVPEHVLMHVQHRIESGRGEKLTIPLPPWS